ncbi:MAG: nucleoside 2-deoxyribosyltransferase [Alphaproteobacteria bacterium]
MARPLIYLAGPMAGISWFQAVDDRLALANVLGRYGLDVLSPVSGLDVSNIRPAADPALTPPLQHFLDPGVYIARDLTMLRRCDAVLADLRRSRPGHALSTGTTFELGFAHALSKPIFLLAPRPWRDEHRHPFVLKTASAAYRDPEDVAAVLAGFLIPGVGVTGMSADAWKIARQRADNPAPPPTGRMSATADEQGLRGAPPDQEAAAS